jgi:hypothetical protein
MNERRMEAECVRDSILYSASRLDLTIGGPDLNPDTAEACRRRSLYFKHTPEDSPLFLNLFDRADPVECYRRVESVVPQQPLALLNSSLSVTSARVLAGELTRQLSATSPETDAAFITAAFEQLLTRAPSEAESEKCLTFLRRQTFTFRKTPNINPHQRARENLIHVLYNYNEFLAIR